MTCKRKNRAITKQWEKRERQIDMMMEATAGMYGELQGIAGQTLQEIQGLDLEDAGGWSGKSADFERPGRRWRRELRNFLAKPASKTRIQ